MEFAKDGALDTTGVDAHGTIESEEQTVDIAVRFDLIYNLKEPMKISKSLHLSCYQCFYAVLFPRLLMFINTVVFKGNA